MKLKAGADPFVIEEEGLCRIIQTISKRPWNSWNSFITNTGHGTKNSSSSSGMAAGHCPIWGSETTRPQAGSRSSTAEWSGADIPAVITLLLHLICTGCSFGILSRGRPLLLEQGLQLREPFLRPIIKLQIRCFKALCSLLPFPALLVPAPA